MIVEDLATLLSIMVLELSESAAHGGSFFLTRLRLRPTTYTGFFPLHARRSGVEPR